MKHYFFAENIALNKAAHYVTYDGLEKDAAFVLDGRKLKKDRRCLIMYGQTKLFIDLGEILSIHHIKTFFSGFGVFVGMYMYIPIFSGFFLFLFGTPIVVCYNEYSQLFRT